MNSCEYLVVDVRKIDISCSFERSNGLKRYKAGEISFDKLCNGGEGNVMKKKEALVLMYMRKYFEYLARRNNHTWRSLISNRIYLSCSHLISFFLSL
jgi:hypothetical protein